MFQDEDMLVGVNCEVAEIFGLQTATVYNRVGWLNSNNEDATVDTVLDGFPFMTVNQVKHSLRTLEKAGAVVASQPNLQKMDTTKCYFACGVHNG